MNHTPAFVALGSGIDLDRVRELFSGGARTEYANLTVFVEAPTIDPMALRLQQALAETAHQAKPAADLVEQPK